MNKRGPRNRRRETGASSKNPMNSEVALADHDEQVSPRLDVSFPVETEKEAQNSLQDGFRLRLERLEKGARIGWNSNRNYTRIGEGEDNCLEISIP